MRPFAKPLSSGTIPPLSALAAAFLILSMTALPSFQARGDSLVPRESALKAVREKNACKLAVGISPPGRQEIEPRVICVAEIVKDTDTVDEDLGCSVVLFDVASGGYRAGKSNLRIATRLPCDARGLAKLDPRPFADHAAREGHAAHVLHSESDVLARWWQGHYSAAVARRKAVAPRPAPAAPQAPAKPKGKWQYDGKSQFQGI